MNSPLTAPAETSTTACDTPKTASEIERLVAKIRRAAHSRATGLRELAVTSGWDCHLWNRRGEQPPLQAICDVLQALGYRLTIEPAERKTPMVDQLLDLLVERRNKPVSVQVIRETLWPHDPPSYWRSSISVHVSHLRKRGHIIEGMRGSYVLR